MTNVNAGYWTVVIPPAPAGTDRTLWHAPDQTITRGAFESEAEAVAWATRLNGLPYSLRFEPGIEDLMPDSDNAVQV